MTFNGMILTEAPESNIQLCKRWSLMAKVRKNDSCPRFDLERWIFCNVIGVSSSNPRAFFTCHCCHRSFTISFKGTCKAIFPIVVSRSTSSSTSLPLDLFLGCPFGWFPLEISFLGGSLLGGYLRRDFLGRDSFSLGYFDVVQELLSFFLEYWILLNFPLSSTLRIGSFFSSLMVTSLMGGWVYEPPRKILKALNSMILACSLIS